MKKVNFNRLSRFSVILYWLVLIALLGLFFTNDFGILDIHKTSIITCIGIDFDEEAGEVTVTAQLAVPKPSENGENVEYTDVQGNGLTVADALNEINAKTGFYPKLEFCKLILLGETCQKGELFKLVGCLYRKNYSELTALVAMCKGDASEILSSPVPMTDVNSLSVQRVLNEELKKSANVSSVNLKEIAMNQYSKSASCYMPYVESNVSGTSEGGGSGDSVGGDKPPEGGSSSGGGGESGGSGGSQGSGGGSGGEGGQSVEYTARKTALFAYGKFVGILDDHQSFALDLLKNDVRLAVVPCKVGDKSYTVGMKNADAGIKLKVNAGVPELTLSFKAKAQVQGATEVVDPKDTVCDDVVPEEILKSATEEVKKRMEDLVKTCVESDCDVFGAKELLFRHNYKYFDAFKGDLLKRMKVNYEINIKSVN